MELFLLSMSVAYLIISVKIMLIIYNKDTKYDLEGRYLGSDSENDLD